MGSEEASLPSPSNIEHQRTIDWLTVIESWPVNISGGISGAVSIACEAAEETLKVAISFIKSVIGARKSASLSVKRHRMISG